MIKDDVKEMINECMDEFLCTNRSDTNIEGREEFIEELSKRIIKSHEIWVEDMWNDNIDDIPNLP